MYCKEMVNDNSIQNEKKDLNSLKAMFYPMNVFNERNICGFFPLSHTIIINLIINFLLIIQFNLNALQIIEYNFHYFIHSGLDCKRHSL